MIRNLKLKKCIQELYKNPPKDGRVICVDEFGPLEIRPYPGKGWFRRNKPARQRADYTRTHGVRHLLAAYDLKGDKLFSINFGLSKNVSYGHNTGTATWTVEEDYIEKP